MSDQVHTADACPDCDGLGRLLDLSDDDSGRRSCSVRCGACCGTGKIPTPGPLAPCPDEWGGLDLDAELARIEANLARWEEDLSVPEADELADRIAKDADTLVAVLRRADRVIRAQGRDLAELREQAFRLKRALGHVWETCNDSNFRDPKAQVWVSFNTVDAALNGLSAYPDSEADVDLEHICDRRDWLLEQRRYPIKPDAPHTFGPLTASEVTL